MRKFLCLVTILVILHVLGCGNSRFSAEELEKRKPVMPKGTKIEATTDYGTLTVIANKDSQRIVSIDGMKNFVRINLSETKGEYEYSYTDAVECIGRIKRLWDDNSGVFVSDIYYIENPADYRTIERANQGLKYIYNNWPQVENPRELEKVGFVWIDDGLRVQWSIYQPEYWIFPTPYRLLINISQTYINGEKPQGLFKCPYTRNSLTVEHLTDEQIKNLMSKKTISGK